MTSQWAIQSLSMTLEHKHRMEDWSLDPEPLPGMQGGRGQCHSSFLAFLLAFFSFLSANWRGRIHHKWYFLPFGGVGGMEVTGIWMSLNIFIVLLYCFIFEHQQRNINYMFKKLDHGGFSSLLMKKNYYFLWLPGHLEKGHRIDICIFTFS